MASEPTISFTDPFPVAIEPAGSGARFSKTSSISYHPSTLRDPRERNPQKHRPLIIVIPPNILLDQHAQPGHTFLLGPRQRHSQGTVMPLRPTMYAQLMAIAREFNFPSTAGLCLYLHYSENGVTITPRISDESWQSLWNFAFENPPPSARILPISGTIELDVDLRQARWYLSWVSSALRYSFDLSPPTHLHTASENHRRSDSQMTVYDEHASGQRDTESHQPAVPVPIQRPFPRKLSLAERFDISNSKVMLQPTSSSPEKSALVQTLSPITQESEPSAARHKLITRVESWRDDALLNLATLAAAKEHSLEPTNIINTVRVDTPPGTSDSLNLEHTWSITSAGPGDYDFPVSADSERLPSIYLEHRMMGSVCPTPSVGTSFGPVDYGFDSPTKRLRDLPSPDLAHRAIDSAPLTPVTATTWGPQSPFPSSPSNISYAASVDIGRRHVWSPPLSASSTTSWGPPLLDPPSPLISPAPLTPDIGHRALDWDDVTAYRSQPYCASDSQRDDRLLGIERLPQPVNCYRGYPYLNIYLVVYPYFDLYPVIDGGPSLPILSVGQTSVNQSISVILNQYPSFNLYPPVYPFLDIYPGVLQLSPLPVHHQPSKTSANAYPFYPVATESNDYSELQLPITFRLESLSIRSQCYPVFDLYPAIYPHFNLYPPVTQFNSPHIDDTSTLDLLCPCSYPTLIIYPPVFPHFDLYPSRLEANIGIPASQVPMPVDVHLYPRYPIIDLYPSVYPYLNIYPIYPTVTLTNNQHALRNILYSSCTQQLIS